VGIATLLSMSVSTIISYIQLVVSVGYFARLFAKKNLQKYQTILF